MSELVLYGIRLLTEQLLGPVLAPRGGDPCLELLTVETLSFHGLCVALGSLEVPVGEDGLVGVPDDEDPPTSELLDVTSSPGEVAVSVVTGVDRPVMGIYSAFSVVESSKVLKYFEDVASSLIP